jgi:hypothetical protein
MRCVTTTVGAGHLQHSAGDVWLARRVVDTLGGRYSTELGIDVDAGDAEIERWFLAATLFGTRTSAAVAARTFRVLCDAGLARIGHARRITRDDLFACLDKGGYAHYAGRAATLLQSLCDVAGERYDGRAAVIGRRFTTYPAVRAALDVLPGWGPVTIQLFLRELRGVWPGAQPPLDQRAAYGGRHLGLLGPDQAPLDVPHLARLAAECHTDRRDLESGLVRLTLAHHRGRAAPCPGGYLCAPLG